MGSNGSSVSYHSVCKAISHGNCSACGLIVYRISDHVHVVYKDKTADETLCFGCWRLIALAAHPMLRAAEAMGLQASFTQLRDALDRGDLSVMYQLDLPVA